jgi:hypothetical protein
MLLKYIRNIKLYHQYITILRSMGCRTQPLLKYNAEPTPRHKIMAKRMRQLSRENMGIYVFS